MQPLRAMESVAAAGNEAWAFVRLDPEQLSAGNNGSSSGGGSWQTLCSPSGEVLSLSSTTILL